MPTPAQEQVRTHALWAVVDKMKSVLDSVSVPDDEVPAAAYGRVARVVEELRLHREQSTDLYSVTLLQAVLNALTPVSSHLDQFGDDADDSDHIINAEASLEPVLTAMAQLPSLPPKGKAMAAGKAAASYERASVASLESWKANAAKVDGSFDELEAKVQALTKSADEQIQAAIDEASKEARQREDEAWRPHLDEVQTRLGQARAELDQMRALHSESKNVASALADKAVAHDYRASARNKAVGGWVWDVIGTVIGLAALGLLAYHLLAVDKEPTTPLALTRLAVSVAGVSLAALCFGRARTFHRESRLAKRTDLRISTVKAFIANMDPEVQEAVMEGMAERLYMRGELEPVSEDDTNFQGLEEMRERLRARRTIGEDDEPEV